MRFTVWFILAVLPYSLFGQDAPVLCLGNTDGLCLPDSNIRFCESLPEDLDSVEVILFFSGSTSSLKERDVDRITAFLENGGGLYLGAENHPLQSETNQITRTLYNKECFGEFNEEQAQAGGNGSNLDLQDYAVIPAGTTTVAFPMDHRLTVEAWVQDEPLILSGSWEFGRVVIDGGYSRFYCENRDMNSDYLLKRILDYLGSRH